MVSLLVQNRYLLQELVWRDVRARYIGSLVGLFWSVLNPLLQLLLYTLIFSVVLDVRFSERATTGEFAQLLFGALLPWMALQESTTRCARSFVDHSNLIQKIRFPLEIIPFSVAASSFIHQLLGTGVFVIILVFNQSLNFRLFPLLFLLFIFQIILMYGIGLTVACIHVYFRDVAQILGVLFMLLFWLTPIVYPKSLAPDTFQWILHLNPLTHMVEAYRYSLLGLPVPSMWGILYWIGFCLAAYGFGHFVLRRTRTELVDLV